MSIHTDLQKYKKSWKTSKPKEASAGGRYTAVPDGKYTVSLDNMEIGYSKNKNLQVVSTFVIKSGKHKGETPKRFDRFDDDAFPYMKAYFETIGLEYPDDIDDLESTIDEFKENFDSLIDINIVTSGDFTNVYVNGINTSTNDDDTVEEEEEKAEEEEEEAPKRKSKR